MKNANCFQEAQERAEHSSKRAEQKYEIVQYGHGNSWRKLEDAAVEATGCINIGPRPLLYFRQLKKCIGFTLEPARSGSKPVATVRFEERLHRIVVEFSGSREKLIYEIRANDDNQAEFVDPDGHPIKEQAIIKEILDWLK